MNALLNDTILAVSSPRGPGGVRAIIRLSGPAAWQVVHHVAGLSADATVGWHEARLGAAGASIPAALLLFRAPRSFTGEDLAELHVPNSPALLDLLLREILRHTSANAAVRLAEPGEFTALAFFNGKVDLTQAEGIAATINAANLGQLRAAAGLRSGDLYRWTQATADKLAHLLALVEAGIDFADEEDIRFVEAPQLRTALTELQTQIHHQLSASRRLARRDQLPTVVFIGLPNVGKSSLINALAQRERSIVSPIAGTTRDMLATVMHTPQGDIRLLDVPGEEAPADDLHEKMMATRRNALLEADLIVIVTSPDHPTPPETPPLDSPHITIQNKSDLTHNAGDPPGVQASACPSAEGPPAQSLPFRRNLAPAIPLEPWQRVSAKTGHNLPALLAYLTHLRFQAPAGGAHLELNQRHRTLLEEVLTTLHQATTLVDHAAIHPELLAAELRRALDLLGQITGTISPDEVLGRIFSQFCLGK